MDTEDLKDVLMLGTEKEFRKAMRARGIPEGSQHFLDALAAWREFRP